MSVSAPGKVMLLGEYAVLDGGRALAAAINRRAKAELVPARTPEQYTEIIKAVVARAGRSKFWTDRGIAVDTSSFYDESGKKLGLGSSAAAAIVAASVITGRGDEVVLEIALDAHRDASGGEGSGVDVAACFYGGVIASRKQPSPVIPLASRVKKLELTLLFTGISANTAEFVSAARASPKWSEWTHVMRGIAEEGMRAWELQNEIPFLSVVTRYGRAMQGLGKDAGLPIVTEQIDAIMRLAEEAKAAAKPSGAGGGDVVVMWSHDAETPRRIAEKTGARVIEAAIDSRGLARK